MEKLELEKMIADVKNTIAETRELNKEKAQERALNEKPIDGSNETKLFADLQSAMKEHRAITLSGTNEVSVAHSLVKGLQEKSDLLNLFSISVGGKANQIIPVWKNDLSDFAPVAEGGTFTGDEGQMATINLMPYAFAKQIKITDETLKLSAVNFEVEMKDLLNKALSKTILNQVFKGTGSAGQFTSIITGATNVETAKWDAVALQKFVLENVATKSDDAVILMNPAQFAAIENGTGNKDKVLIEQIENRIIEGHKIIVSAFVPGDVYAIAGELSNYGIGVADQLDIKEKDVAGTLAHTYDCSAYLCGKPIVEKDFFVLKATM